MSKLKVSQIETYNFRCFHHKKIEFINKNKEIRPFTVLIGDNGAGKTAILESIAKAFVPVLRQVNKDVAKDFDDIRDADIKNDSKWTAVGIEAMINEEKFSWHNHRRFAASIEMKELGDLKPQKAVKEFIGNNMKYSGEDNRIPLVIYYSINRMFLDVPRRASHVSSRIGEASEALENSFSIKNDFRRFYNWFKLEEENELRMLRKDKNYFSYKLDAVRRAISLAMGNYSDLRIEAQPSRMVMSNSKNEEHNVVHLSGGYKAIFTLVCDIASRLALANPNSKDPLKCKALILIDELDLHLHPKWQKRIVSDLKRTFPNCQFIVTTHSPFIIQSLDLDEVINLEVQNHTDNNEGNYRGWTIDEIQEYEMGVDIKTPEYLGLLKEFDNAVDNNGQNAKVLYNTISNMLHPNSSIRKLLKLDMVKLEEETDD